MSAAPAALTDATRDRELRRTFGCYATGVAVVATVHEGRPVGLTVNSFTSVSLDPPLVSWCVHRDSRRRPAFTAGGHFSINVLAAHQADLAVRFSRSGWSFDGVAHDLSPLGPPVLRAVVGVLVCRPEQVIPAGDHLLLIARVLEHRANGGQPLVFLDGRYH